MGSNRSIFYLHRTLCFSLFAFVSLIAVPAKAGGGPEQRPEYARGTVAAPECRPKIVVTRKDRIGNHDPTRLSNSYFTTTYRRESSAYKPFEWDHQVKVINLGSCSSEALKRITLSLASPRADVSLMEQLKREGSNQQCLKGQGVNTEWKFLLTYQTRDSSPGIQTFKLRLKDGTMTLDEHLIHLVVRSKWRGYMMPGAHFAFYRPDGASGTALQWLGISLEYVLNNWIIRDEKRGPSHGKVYLTTSLLRSDVRPELTLIYGMGTHLSFERNPSRDYLLPFFGFELGGIYSPHREGHLNRFQITPRTGINLYASESSFVSLSGGYLIPPFGGLEALRGWRADFGLHFTLW